MKTNKLAVRLNCYLAGLFVMTMVVVSLITCLIVLHGLGSVGLGTVVVAVFVGVALKQITKLLGSKRDTLLGRNQENIA